MIKFCWGVWPLLLCACTSNLPNLDQCKRLNGDEIKIMFADVIDTAEVKDGNGGQATNHWYADGRFTSDWSTQDASGELTGTWHTDGDLRCVVIGQILPDGGDGERCGPLYQCKNMVVSVNADGGVHGAHSLTPIFN